MELREMLTYFAVDRRISETSYQCKCPHHYDNKAKDPETAITRYLVKQMVKQGMIPSFRSGNKKFVDVDVMEKCIDDLAGID